MCKLQKTFIVVFSMAFSVVAMASRALTIVAMAPRALSTFQMSPQCVKLRWMKFLCCRLMWSVYIFASDINIWFFTRLLSCWQKAKLMQQLAPPPQSYAVCIRLCFALRSRSAVKSISGCVRTGSYLIMTIVARPIGWTRGGSEGSAQSHVVLRIEIKLRWWWNTALRNHRATGHKSMSCVCDAIILKQGLAINDWFE